MLELYDNEEKKEENKNAELTNLLCMDAVSLWKSRMLDIVGYLDSSPLFVLSPPVVLSSGVHYSTRIFPYVDLFRVPLFRYLLFDLFSSYVLSKTRSSPSVYLSGFLFPFVANPYFPSSYPFVFRCFCGGCKSLVMSPRLFFSVCRMMLPLSEATEELLFLLRKETSSVVREFVSLEEREEDGCYKEKLEEIGILKSLKMVIETMKEIENSIEMPAIGESFVREISRNFCEKEYDEKTMKRRRKKKRKRGVGGV